MTEEVNKSIFQKLNEAREELQSLNLKKTGENSYAKYKYYELGDFLPYINQINKDKGLCSVVSFENDYAKLTIYDTESTADNIDEIEFTSPMVEAVLKGSTPIQALGAAETYQRRYLYMTAYEIVEHDAIDTQKPEKEKPVIDWRRITTALSSKVSKTANDLSKQHRAIITTYEAIENLEENERYIKMYDAAEKRILKGESK